MSWVLGIAASHNGAACLLHDGEIVVAIQEERITRKKRAFLDPRSRSLAVEECLAYAGLHPEELDLAVVCATFGDQATDAQQLEFHLLQQHGVPTRAISHHLGHAIGAFATSGFEEAAVLVIDGMGSGWSDLSAREQATCKHSSDSDRNALCEHASIFAGRDRALEPLEKHVSPVSDVVRWMQTHPSGAPPFESLGGMFNSVATHAFGQFFEAGKVMGLAPYGRVNIPEHAFFEIVDATFRFQRNALSEFDGLASWPENPARWQNLAASVQAALEVGVSHLVTRARELSESTNLCYAGGVALNGIANEQIVRDGGFDNVFIMPAAEDSGTSIGAAYYGAWQLGDAHPPRAFDRDSLGPKYSNDRIRQAIAANPRVTIASSDVVDLLIDGKILGWFSGGSELGPRALGQRSILCDPRPPGMKDRVNARVKFREAYRPFAPIVLREHASDWFGDDRETKFMLQIRSFQPNKRELVPAVVHVDGTGRPQTITRSQQPELYELLQSFHQRTQVPMLLNTSLNVAGEPIVETPEDAIACLLASGLDALVLEGTLVVER